MPELPEVETIKNTVKNAVENATILKAEVLQPKLRELVPSDFSQRIQKAKIVKLRRIAKYMLLDLDNGLTIIWHFGMSGKIRIESAKPTELNKHDHAVIVTDKAVLIYNDTRRFGLISLCQTKNLREHHCFKNVGVDPWDAELTDEYLLQKFKKRKTAIKIALLDQSIIGGIGNIYASEILYKAQILPQRESESITQDEAQKIIIYTREILEKAIAAGGSTIHDYKRPDGNIGYFQEQHCVYNKTGKRCPDCKCNINITGGIQKIVQGGRSTFFCTTRQK